MRFCIAFQSEMALAEQLRVEVQDTVGAQVRQLADAGGRLDGAVGDAEARLLAAATAQADTQLAAAERLRTEVEQTVATTLERLVESGESASSRMQERVSDAAASVSVAVDGLPPRIEALVDRLASATARAGDVITERADQHRDEVLSSTAGLQREMDQRLGETERRLAEAAEAQHLRLADGVDLTLTRVEAVAGETNTRLRSDMERVERLIEESLRRADRIGTTGADAATRLEVLTERLETTVARAIQAGTAASDRSVEGIGNAVEGIGAAVDAATQVVASRTDRSTEQLVTTVTWATRELERVVAEGRAALATDLDSARDEIGRAVAVLEQAAVRGGYRPPSAPPPR